MMVSDYSVNRIARITGGNFLPMELADFVRMEHSL